MANFSQYQVRLFRDSFDTAWGFRLQGGKDLGQPLTVQRVFTGSPAEGELQRGDIIVSIADRQAETLTHKQAQDLIKFGGGSIFLVIRRPPPGRVQVAKQPKPVHTSAYRPVEPAMPRKGKIKGGLGGYGPELGTDFGVYIQPVHSAPKPMPKKAGKIKSGLGGHGPEFGTDFNRPAPQLGRPSRPGHDRSMLHQVQYTLDSKTQYGQYDPDSVITTPQYTPMRPHSQQFQSLIDESSEPQFSEPRPSPAFQQQQQIFVSSAPIQSYRPGPPEPEDENYEIVPVAERKKAFMGDTPRKWGNAQETPVNIKRAPPPAPKSRSPIPPSQGPEFGLSFTSPTSAWSPPSQNFSSAPSALSPTQPFVSQTTFAPASTFDDEPPKMPAWRGSLRQTGTKPWDEEFSTANFTPPQAPASRPPPQAKPVQSRSVTVSHHQAPARTAQPFSPARSNPQVASEQTEGEGPRIVHLQYNSPMAMYSNENVQETLEGQTRNVVIQKGPPGTQDKDGPRDWSQSAVLRMIQQEESQSGPTGKTTVRSTTVQSYSQPVAPHAAAFQPMGADEMGTSDF